MEKKFACLLYRTKTTEQENQAEMERQRGACLQFAQEQGWLPIREFWCSEEDGHPINEDPLLELRACAEQAQFQILLVSEFDRIGRVPVECSAAAAFFERHGVEVWTAADGHMGKLVRLKTTAL